MSLPYKLLIVEDDVMYRYAVKTLIDQSEGRYRFLEEAINGRHALEIIARESPDIIITDMSMPEMDGVELIRRVKASAPEIKILVLSAYDDFHFVKEALKLGAEDYLLKYELEERGVNDLLRKTCDKIKREREFGRRDSFIRENTANLIDGVFRKIVAQGETNSEKIDKFMDQLFPGKGGFPVGLAVFRTTIDERSKKTNREIHHGVLHELLQGNSRLYLTEAEDGVFVAIINLTSIPNPEEILNGFRLTLRRAAEALSSDIGTEVHVGLSRIITDGVSLADRYLRAYRLTEKGFYLSKSAVFSEADVYERVADEIDWTAFVKEIVAASDADDTRVAVEKAIELFALFRSVRPDLDVLDAAVRDLFSELFVSAKRRKIDFAEATGCVKIPSRSRDAAVRLDDLEHFVITCLENLSSGTAKTELEYRREIRLAIDYIKRNYRSEVQLPVLAAKLGLSPNYLCSLFRKETGMRLVEYLHKVRINEAIVLLKSTNLRVYEIADRTGFRSASNFCRIFKEVTGGPISDFRKTIT
ncbi:MAG: response regulator [Treponemataceae bacterium]